MEAILETLQLELWNPFVPEKLTAKWKFIFFPLFSVSRVFFSVLINYFMEIKCGAVLKNSSLLVEAFRKTDKPNSAESAKWNLLEQHRSCDGILHSSERDERISDTDNDESIANEGET